MSTARNVKIKAQYTFHILEIVIAGNTQTDNLDFEIYSQVGFQVLF